MFNVFRRILEVERPLGQFDEDGLWVASGLDQGFVKTIKASVQATDAEILQTLPEGYRTKETHTLYSNDGLRIAKVGVYNADIVVINGDRFQVVKVTEGDNLHFATKHYEMVVVKIDDDNVN